MVVCSVVGADSVRVDTLGCGCGAGGALGGACGGDGGDRDDEYDWVAAECCVLY